LNTYQISLIENIIEYIENNLEFPLTSEDISREAGLSKFHLQRLFKALVNNSLISYVRGRRLSVSIHDLLYTDTNIIDIAIKYQFEYEQSYIRAFEKQFHITPAKYRKARYELPIIQKLDINTITAIEQGMILQPKMVIKPQFYIQGIKEEIFHEHNLVEFTTNKLAMLFKEKYLSLIPNRINEHIYLAIIEYRPKRLISNYYIPCIETTVLNPVEDPFVSYTIPMQEYAVFKYIGFHAPEEITFKTIEDFYSHIMIWKGNSNYKKEQPYHFERIDLSICSDSYCEMDIYIPIN
jgi:AraC family transcriptional regulator